MPHTLSAMLPVRQWEWLSCLGTSGLDDREARRVKLTNQGAALIAIFTLGFNALYSLYDFKGLSPAIYFNTFSVVVYAVVLGLNHKGRHLLSKTVMMTMGISQLLVLCWLFGSQCGLNLFYFATTFYCVMIFSESEKVALLGFSFVSIIFYLLTYFLFSGGPGVLNPAASLLVIVHVSSFLGTFVIIGAFVWLFYNDVQHAEKLLKHEHERSESLLQNILPQAVITRLKRGEKTIADRYAGVTVVFADIVGFTKLSTLLPPKELVAKLNLIFSRFDKLVDDYGLEKIKTIGDAYMVACGLPEPRADHVQVAAEFALRMQDVMDKIESDQGNVFQIRIGMHTGPAVAGVIGTRKFAYDVWGDTVNTASRMESHGVPGEIQVSETTYQQLKEDFILEERGWMEIKGKGKMQTYLLKGMVGQDKSPGY
jgi:class 3 adenylate cyclase